MAPPILHWITLKCPKPWDLRANATAALPADCNASNYQLWWRMYNRTGRDVLSAVRPPSRLNHRRASEYSGANEYDGCSHLCPNDWVGDGKCALYVHLICDHVMLKCHSPCTFQSRK